MKFNYFFLEFQDHYTYPCQLSKIELFVLSHKTCNKEFHGFFIGEDTLCAVRPPGKGICYGDSGKILSLNNENRLQID